jgi:hypothetical protein
MTAKGILTGFNERDASLAVSANMLASGYSTVSKDKKVTT